MKQINVFAFKVYEHLFKHQQQKHTFQSNSGERQRWNLGWTSPSTDLWYAPLHNTPSGKAEVSR